MAEIHYHIERPGPRARYIIHHLLGTMAGWDAKEVPDRKEFRQCTGAKLIYGKEGEPDAFHVQANGLLEQSGIAPFDVQVSTLDGLPLLFPTDVGDLAFDVFAAAFFALSRYEEYAPLARDAHGRPLSTSLHAGQHGYLQRPVVDAWLGLMAEAWRARGPSLPPMRREYRHVATLDADNGAMFLGRPWWRSAGAAARDLLHGRLARVRDRAAVLAGAQADPYAVHEAFIALAKGHGARAVLNFMVAPRGKHDHAIPADHAIMRRVIGHAAAHAEVGLHPGYSAADRPGQIEREKQRLEAVAGLPISRSRQHFLRFRLPDTLIELERAGIQEEHSMGLADRTGFRAGTCTPFPFYDLHAECCTGLMLYPFMVMDSVLCYKMGLSPAAAEQEAKRMVDIVRRVKGTFVSVWHERFLSGYGEESGWEDLAPAIIQYARP